MISDTTDRIRRTDDAITTPYRREPDGSGFVVMVVLGFGALFWLAWVCGL